MYVSFDDNLIVRNVSNNKVRIRGLSTRWSEAQYDWFDLVGKRIPWTMMRPEDFSTKDPSELKIAFVCNWNDQCGISTYSKFLVDSIRPKVADIKIFSEETEDQTGCDEDFVVRCWKRGESLIALSKEILDYQPDFVIVQHEYGIFPNAFRFMQFMQRLENVPYAVTMHSTYEHLDKLVYSECVKNIVTHTQEAKDVLQQLGNTNDIHVIPHGCIEAETTEELWNIMLNPYTVMQFGFGFEYKGVDNALRAIAELKHSDPKFENIFYFYLCSSNSRNSQSHLNYYESLMKLAEELDIEDNVAIVRKYQTDRMLSLYLRLAKLVIFPYVVNGDNKVYGSSGAIRVAMAHKRPVIASDSHLFDDLEGIVPRPSNPQELAEAIDGMFSCGEIRDSSAEAAFEYTVENSWDSVAEQYVALYNKIIEETMRR